MSIDALTTAVVDALDSAGIPYVIVGSLSSNEWGIARSTNDADLVIDLGSTPIGALSQRLPPQFHLDPQIRFEGVTGTSHNVIAVTGSAFRIELFRLSDDPHDRRRFERRVLVKAAGHDLWMAAPEDVIITKLRWFARGSRPKDKDDATGVIAVQGASLDWNYIHQWCDEHGTRELLDAIRRGIPADL